MKPVPSSVKVESRGLQNTVKFGIKSSGLHHILGILRNQLYSDKVLAVVREYSTNAVDAMIEAGKGDTPVEVTLPNRLNPYFKVRDFGLALTDEEIQDVYAFYGESTKRNSNDVTGMLGIGSKSAFAYGDNFVINSYTAGTKHIYNAFIDESQLGQISKIGEESTDEPDGVEIVVPTKESDADEFYEKAKDLFEWFNVRPIIKGAKPFDYTQHPVLFSGTGWKWRDVRRENHYGSRSGAVVVMGNIGYPIDEYSLNLNSDEEKDLSSLLCENLVLEIPIGEVEISASREKLQYTDFTRKSLIKKLKNVQSELVETVGKEFDSAETLFDAKCLYGSVFDYGSPLYALRNVLADKLKWNGQTVDSNSFNAWVKGDDSYEDEYANCVQFTQGSSRRFNTSGRYKTDKTRHINCEKNVVVIENDQGHNRGIMGRILPLIFNESKKPYMMRFATPAKKKTWLKESKFDGELIKLSSLPKQALSDFYGSNAGNGIASTKDVKHSAKCFEFDWDNAPDRTWHSKKSDFWKISDLDVDSESGVYVIIDKFQIERNHKGYATLDEPRTIKTLKETIEQIGLKFPKRIYAFKVKERAKIENKDGWVSLHDWAKESLFNVIEKKRLHQSWIDLQKIDELAKERFDDDRYNQPEAGIVIDSLLKLEFDLAARSGTMAMFLSKYRTMAGSNEIRKIIKAVNEIASSYNVEFSCPKDVKPTYDISGEWNKALQKYEVLTLTSSSIWGYDYSEKKGKKIVNYINVVDVCELAKKP